jgi:LytS/YehU family sensor histidine kinase
MTFIWLALAALYSKILDYFSQSQSWYGHFYRAIPFLAATGLFLYFMVCLIYYLFLTFEKRKEAEQMALENHLLASKAELNSLKASVHPHFLFNSLTALSTLIRTSPEKAQKMCLQISDFLRYSLSYGQQEWVEVKDEMEHINNYLEIEKVRIGDRLKTDFQADKDTVDVTIPPFSLLPLVENAVKHALQQTLKSFTLTIRIKKIKDNLFIAVKNPYEKIYQTSPKGGFGLKGLKKRLIKTYGDDDALLTVNKGKADFTVKLQLPIKRKIKNE